MTRRHKILVIDDSPLILRAATEILKESYDIIIAKSGETGIAIAKRDKPDLVLLDIVMPGLSGFETLVYLKAYSETKNIPVMLVSGSESVEEQERGRKEGAIGFVKKPFTPGEILESIANILH